MKNYNIIFSEPLQHHGIKGQKWGKRNGPPYPLDYDSHSAKQKKENPKGKLDNYKNNNSKKKKFSNKNIGMTVKEKNTKTKIVAAISLGATAATAILMSKSMDSYDKDYLIELGKEIAPTLVLNAGITLGMVAINKATKSKEKQTNMNKAQFSDIKKGKPSISKEKDMEKVNPNFHKGPEYQSNCMLCTTAYELRRRGYDVEANTSKVGRSEKDAAKYFNIKEEDRFYHNNVKDLEADMKRMPNGSRGNLMCEVGVYKSLHSMVWEKENNKIIIRDCQTNSTYNSLEDSPINSKSTYNYFYRSDDKEINEELIMDAVQPRKK